MEDIIYELTHFNRSTEPSDDTRKELIELMRASMLPTPSSRTGWMYTTEEPVKSKGFDEDDDEEESVSSPTRNKPYVGKWSRRYSNQLRKAEQSTAIVWHIWDHEEPEYTSLESMYTRIEMLGCLTFGEVVCPNVFVKLVVNKEQKVIDNLTVFNQELLSAFSINGVVLTEELLKTVLDNVVASTTNRVYNSIKSTSTWKYYYTDRPTFLTFNSNSSYVREKVNEFSTLLNRDASSPIVQDIKVVVTNNLVQVPVDITAESGMISCLYSHSNRGTIPWMQFAGWKAALIHIRGQLIGRAWVKENFPVPGAMIVMNGYVKGERYKRADFSQTRFISALVLEAMNTVAPYKISRGYVKYVAEGYDFDGNSIPSFWVNGIVPPSKKGEINPKAGLSVVYVIYPTDIEDEVQPLVDTMVLERVPGFKRLPEFEKCSPLDFCSKCGKVVGIWEINKKILYTYFVYTQRHGIKLLPREAEVPKMHNTEKVNERACESFIKYGYCKEA